MEICNPELCKTSTQVPLTDIQISRLRKYILFCEASEQFPADVTHIELVTLFEKYSEAR